MRCFWRSGGTEDLIPVTYLPHSLSCQGLQVPSRDPAPRHPTADWQRLSTIPAHRLQPLLAAPAHATLHIPSSKAPRSPPPSQGKKRSNQLRPPAGRPAAPQHTRQTWRARRGTARHGTLSSGLMIRLLLPSPRQPQLLTALKRGQALVRGEGRGLYLLSPALAT